MTEIIPGDTVTVRTGKGDFKTKKIVITAGPWAPKIMEKLGVKLPFKVGQLVIEYSIMEIIHPHFELFYF